MKKVRVALLGCGTVGRGFVELVGREHGRIRSRYGLDLQLTRILVRDLGAQRPGVHPGLLSDCTLEVLDSDFDVAVELVGGVHSAGSYVRRVLRDGRHVVTANKELLAASGDELFAQAARAGVRLGFEASVCGGVPVIGALRRGLAGDSVLNITGILNGTSNYVLCRMQEGADQAAAVRLAQAAGFAEADPALDLSGQDSGHKLRILAGLAFGLPVRQETVTGIETVTLAAIESARRRGAVIRLVAEASRVAGGIELRVEPREVPAASVLGRIENETNALIIRGQAVGEVILTGRGAGSLPTAAAVLSDVIDVAA